MSLQEDNRNYRTVLMLTLVPVTGLFGINWFYIRNIPVGFLKAVFIIIPISVYLYLYIAKPGLEAIVYLFVALIILAFSIIWWLVDIYRIIFLKQL